MVIISKHETLGKGVFSTKNYESGDKIVALSGHTYSPFDGDCNALRIGSQIFWKEMRHNILRFLNHSCKANAFFDIARAHGTKNKTLISLFALTRINSKEHITIDYDAYSWDMKATKCSFPCKCGNKSCRGIIAGFRFLSNSQKKQIGYISPHVIKEQFEHI